MYVQEVEVERSLECREDALVECIGNAMEFRVVDYCFLSEADCLRSCHIAHVVDDQPAPGACVALWFDTRSICICVEVIGVVAECGYVRVEKRVMPWLAEVENPATLARDNRLLGN